MVTFRAANLGGTCLVYTRCGGSARPLNAPNQVELTFGPFQRDSSKHPVHVSPPNGRIQYNNSTIFVFVISAVGGDRFPICSSRHMMLITSPSVTWHRRELFSCFIQHRGLSASVESATSRSGGGLSFLVRHLGLLCPG